MNTEAIYMATLAQKTEDVIRGGLIKLTDNESTVQLDRNRPPAGHLAFNEIGSIDVPLVGAAETVVHQFRVPTGYDGVVWQLQVCLQASGVLIPGSGDVVWRIYADDTTIRNFSNMTSEFGNITSGPEEVDGIRLKNGQVIKITVTHVANALIAGKTIARMKGYYYPSDTI